MRYSRCLAVLLAACAVSLGASAAGDAHVQRLTRQVQALAQAEADADRRADLLIRLAGVQAQDGAVAAARHSVAGLDDWQREAQAIGAIAVGQALGGDLAGALVTARNRARRDIHVDVLTQIAQALVSSYDTRGVTELFEQARRVVQAIPVQHARVRVQLLLDIAKTQAEVGDHYGLDRTLELAAKLADAAADDALRMAVIRARQRQRDGGAHAGAGGRPDRRVRHDPVSVQQRVELLPPGAARVEVYCDAAVALARRGHHGAALSAPIADAFAAAGQEADPYNRAYAYLRLARTMSGINAMLRKQGISDPPSRSYVAVERAEAAAGEVGDGYFRGLALADVARVRLLVGPQAE